MRAVSLTNGDPVCVGAYSQAAPITAAASGSGSFTNAASLLVDGVVPPQTTPYTSSTLVVWNNPAVRFTLDFGSAQTIGSVLLSADNNDTDQVASSLDGVTFANLFTVQPSGGTVVPAQGGFDIFSSDPASPFHIPGPSFAPVSARYLQLAASGGDGIFTAGELEAFAPATPTPMPEPAAVLVFGSGLLAVLAMRRRVVALVGGRGFEPR